MELLDDDQVFNRGLLFTIVDTPKRNKWLERLVLVALLFIAIYMICLKIYVIALTLLFLAGIYFFNLLDTGTTEISIEINGNWIKVMKNERTIHQCRLKQVQLIVQEDIFILKRRYWLLNMGMPSIQGNKSKIEPSLEILEVIMNRVV